MDDKYVQLETGTESVSIAFKPYRKGTMLGYAKVTVRTLVGSSEGDYPVFTWEKGKYAFGTIGKLEYEYNGKKHWHGLIDQPMKNFVNDVLAKNESIVLGNTKLPARKPEEKSKTTPPAGKQEDNSAEQTA